MVSTTGRVLPLKEMRIHADAIGGIARTKLEQTFSNPYSEPLSVTYLLPLPADGAVSAFAFLIGERRIHGEVDSRNKARERYEQAVSEGRSAALLEQDRSSLFTQELGNIPPHTQVIAEITIDQRLMWLSEGAWEYRFPTTVSPRYQGAPGRVADSAKLNVPIADSPIAARAHLDLTIKDQLSGCKTPESPSHKIRFANDQDSIVCTFQCDDGVPLDRDIVMRWPVATPTVGVSITCSRSKPGRNSEYAFGLLTILPPTPANQVEVPRDLILLIDTSGSMGGLPLEQAKSVISAIIQSLGNFDQFEIIEFSNAPNRFRTTPLPATSSNKQLALDWVSKLRAAGATEMTRALFEALTPIRTDAQRQVVLVTDGQIGFESEIVTAVLNTLPKNSRLHTVGVGSAVNRSLNGPAARAGRGVEVVVGIHDDPIAAAKRLIARTQHPLVVDVAIEGSALVKHAPQRVPDLFGGAPTLVGIQLKPEGGTLDVRGQLSEGEFFHRLDVQPILPGSGYGTEAPLFARERVEDLEMELASTRKTRDIDPQIEQIGLDFQICTRLTSWVAVSDSVDIDPRAPSRREVMPHELPYGTNAAGFGLNAAFGPVAAARPFARMGMPTPMAHHVSAPMPQASVFQRSMLQRITQDASCRSDLDQDTLHYAAYEETCCEPGDGSLLAYDAAKSHPQSPTCASDGDLAGSSVVEKAKKFLSRLLPTGRPDSTDGTNSQAPSLPTESGPVTWSGRICLALGKKLVIEIPVVSDSVHWKPEPDATVTFSDGSKLAATIQLSESTAPCKLGPGLNIRVILLLASDPGDKRPERIELTSNSCSVSIRFS
ncbi:MAG: VWA domain-containing protein [Polyangiaceae bacterium]|nr:VWA domain-containing protein [Polyangiaceae bacterium]